MVETRFFTAGVVLLALAATGCAPATSTVRVQPGREPVASRLADVVLPPGTEVVVQLTNGVSVGGTVGGFDSGRLDLLIAASGTHSGLAQPGTAQPAVRAIAADEIQTLARVVRPSQAKRRRLGAVIGAALTVPLSMSMIGDMIIPGAIAGGLIGHQSGKPRAVIVYERGARPLVPD